MEFEATQFDDSLLDPAPEEQDSPVVDEPVAQVGAQEDDVDSDNPYNQTQKQDQGDSELNAYEQFLKERGVRNGRTIVYEDEETGETSEVNFTDLSKEEQLGILNELSDPGLTDDELNTISILRQNNMSLKDLIDYYSDQAVKNYIQNSQATEQQSYSVDQYSDDELYLADLKSRYSDMTDEELITELESAKTNEELFNKKTEAIRNHFKELELEDIKQQEEHAKQAEAEYYKAFNNTLDQFNYVPMDYKDPNAGAIQIENNEKAAIWDYIFKKDAQGLSAFAKDLNNPAKVVEMAWRMLYDADTMSDMTQYWKGELRKTRRSSDQTKSKTNTTVVKNTSRPQTRSVFDDTNNVTSLNPGWGSLL